jgi:hypothetical protein
MLATVCDMLRILGIAKFLSALFERQDTRARYKHLQLADFANIE